jgi:hypothetical protein
MAACDLNQLIADTAGINVLSQSEKEDAFLFYLATAILGFDGVDYTDLNTLREAVRCWCVGGQRLDSFKTSVAINAAVNSGEIATPPTTAEIRANIKCWNCGIGGGERQAMEAFLLCTLLEAAV